jgi:signal transduction histidine kinase
MRKGTLLLVAGVGVPVLVLAVGWWAASAREAQSKEREARALLQRSADVVRGVVDASLEELRAREDARPFDAYNYVYNPPGVVALSDALALSPLARDPEDKRVVGYFQVDKVGDRVIVKTPYEPDPLARTAERARTIATRVESAAFGELTALAVAAPQVVALRPTQANAEEQKQLGKVGTIAELNTLQNQVYKDLKEAETDEGKREQLASQKLLPNISRKNVDWSEPRLSKKKPKQKKSSLSLDYEQKATPNLDVNDAVNADANAPPAQAEPAPIVEYAPMSFDRIGEELVLFRVVSSGGSKSVQGALLDRAQIELSFLPAVIERHVVPVARPTVVREADTAACSLRAPASEILDELELCFPAGAISALDDSAGGFQGGLLGLLVLVVGAAVLVTDRAARRADELARQKTSFISAISHELRTPLTTLRMHAELLRDNLVGPERRAKFHDDMVRESVRLSHLVENVLEATRLEEGRRPLRAQRGDLGAAVKECCDAQSAFVASKGFALEVDAPEVDATFDRQALEQIVVNLLDNAAKYAADATDKTLCISVSDEGARACVRVMDRGPGIPSEQREKVFQRFFRVERPGKDHVVGTGLGLALVRELAQAHGGTAVVEERQGGGCVIAVRIPKQAASAS